MTDNKQAMVDKQPDINAQITEVFRRVNHLKKSEYNTNQNFNFRGFDGVHNAFGAVMRDVRLVEEPHFTLIERSDVQTKSGAVGCRTVVKLEMYFRNSAGQRQLVAETFGEAIDYGDKSMSKAQSVAVRQAFIYAFVLPTQEPDPDHFTYETVAYTAEQAKRDVAEAQTLSALRDVWKKASRSGALTTDVTAAIDARKAQFGGDNGAA